MKQYVYDQDLVKLKLIKNIVAVEMRELYKLPIPLWTQKRKIRLRRLERITRLLYTMVD